MTTAVSDNLTAGAITTQNLTPSAAETPGSAVTLVTGGYTTMAVQVTGVYTGALSAQGTIDGQTWVTLGGAPFFNAATGATSDTIASAATGIWLLSSASYAKLRISANAAVTGSANVTVNAAQGATSSDSAVVAVGNVASAATDSGNPVKVAAKFNNTLPTFADGQRADLQVGSRGSLNVSLISANSTSAIESGNPNSDGQTANYTGLKIFGAIEYWNGASLDKARANFDTGAISTLTAQTAGTVNSTDQTNYNGRGAVFTVNVTAITTATLTVNIQMKDTASGAYVTVLSSTALAVTGTTALTVYPGCVAAANSVANQPLSRTFRVQAVVTGTSVTATVGASMIL